MKERQRCTVFARVCGYLSPLDCWNEGKKSEYDDRLLFDKSVK